MDDDRWSDLHPELLELTFNRVSFPNRLRLHEVCEKWRSKLPHFPKSKDWILLYDLLDNQCLLYNISSPTPWKIDLPELQGGGATCVAQKDGWLLVIRNNQVYFFDPFSRSMLPLPDLPKDPFHCGECLVATFHLSVSKRKYSVYFLNRVGQRAYEIYFMNKKTFSEEQWCVSLYNNGPSLDDSVGLMAGTCGEECACEGGGHFSCWDTTGRWLSYDTITETWNSGDKHDVVVSRDLLHLALDRHLRDWLWRFGENGFSFGMCGGPMEFDGAVAGGSTYTVPFERIDVRRDGVLDQDGSREYSINTRLVKAVCIKHKVRPQLSGWREHQSFFEALTVIIVTGLGCFMFMRMIESSIKHS